MLTHIHKISPILTPIHSSPPILTPVHNMSPFRPDQVAGGLNQLSAATQPQMGVRGHKLPVADYFRAFGRGAAGYGVSACLLYTSPSPRDRQKSRMPSSA